MKTFRSRTGMTVSEEGFTLLEVMLAICIFTVGIMAVASMQMSTINLNSSALVLTEALNVAQDKMEELIGLPVANTQLDDVNGDGDAGLSNPTRAQLTAGGKVLLPAGALNTIDHSAMASSGPRDFYLYWNASPGLNNSRNIAVIVGWYDDGMMRRVDLRSIKF